MAAAEASLSAYPWAMAQAQARMDVYTAPRQAVAGVSFGLSPGSGPAERELDSLMLEIAQVETPASYGLREAVGGELTQAADRFQAFLNRLAQQLAHYAWVENAQPGPTAGLHRRRLEWRHTHALARWHRPLQDRPAPSHGRPGPGVSPTAAGDAGLRLAQCVTTGQAACTIGDSRRCHSGFAAGLELRQ